MTMEIPLGVKRKCRSPSQIKSSKRKRLQESKINILNLSDCTLLNVLQFLDSTALYQLGQTCTRFYNLVQDESLWIHVDGRSQPNSPDKLAFCWQNIHKKTKHLLLTGNQRCDVVFLSEALNSGKLFNLTVLALEHQYIKYCKLNQFPCTLQELSFKHSYIAHNKEFFRFSEKPMSNLKTLILDHCQWFEAQSLQSICKYLSLEILSLYMCKKLSGDDIACISLVGIMGFKRLKVIDLRFTGLGDLFIKSFYNHRSIQIIYFQCFATTYYLERYNRKLDIVNGMKMREHAYLSDDEANNDTSLHSLRKRFNANGHERCNTQTIKDDTMFVFNRLKQTQAPKTKPKSYLYTYPYDECTCGFFDQVSGSYGFGDSIQQDLVPSDDEIDDNQPNYPIGCCSKDDLQKDNYKKRRCDSTSSSDSEDENDWDPKRLQNKLEYEIKKQNRTRHRREEGDIYFISPARIHICYKYTFDSCTNPEWSQVQSTPETCLHNWLFVREPRNDYEIAMLEHTEKHLLRRPNLRSDPDCDCTKTGDAVRNVMYVSRSSSGVMTSFNLRSAVTPRDSNSEEVDPKLVGYFTNKVACCIQRLKTSIDSENETTIVVNEILCALDECLSKKEFFQLLNDKEFVRHLSILFYSLAKSIEQNAHYVLNFHYICFQELLKQLENCTDDSKRKSLLKCFFTNLLCSEDSSKFGENFVIPRDVHVPIETFSNIQFKVRCDFGDEKQNHPGPSGLQQSLKTAESHCNHKNKKKRARTHSAHSIEDSEKTNTDDANRSDEEPPVIRVHEMRLPSHYFQGIQIVQVAEPPQRNTPTNIKELSLRGYIHVTDRTLALLQNMDLDLLDVTGTNVTRLGVQKFMTYNPQCRLIHEIACRCRPKLHF